MQEERDSIRPLKIAATVSLRKYMAAYVVSRAVAATCDCASS